MRIVHQALLRMQVTYTNDHTTFKHKRNEKDSSMLMRAREGLTSPQACRAGDLSAAPCLQVAAGELAAAIRLRQARTLNACIRCFAIG